MAENINWEERDMKRRLGILICLTCLAATTLLAVGGGIRAAETKKFKIFLSMSYTGNDWQAENANMLQAMAKSKAYRDKVELQVQVAGASAQVQSQQINSMVQAGANAIVVFPISPTGLNNAVKAACAKGVIIIAYAANIDEPCAYIVTMDEKQVGPITGQWLVDELHGKGRIVLVTGVAGTSVDADRTNGAKATFAKYPDIKIVAEVNGNWSQATARQELAKVVSTHGWENIDGLWMQVGCYTAADMQLTAGIAVKDVKPCAGESVNGHRVMMLPAGSANGEGSYRAISYRSISYGSPLYSAAYSFKIAVDMLEGNKHPRLTPLPVPIARSGEMIMCKEGTWKEWKATGCNVFPPDWVSPNWFSPIFGEETPEVGFKAAKDGIPEQDYQ
jgi:ribose transport system substrate-binding protein